MIDPLTGKPYPGGEPIEVPIDEFVLPKCGDTVIIRDGKEYHGRRAIVDSNTRKYGDNICVTPMFEVGEPMPRNYKYCLLSQQVEIVPPEEPKDNVTNIFDVPLEASTKDNVVSLGDRSESARRWSVTDMLKDAIKRIEAGEVKNKKAIILFLDDEEHNTYIRNFNQAGMNMTECILLCEMGKQMFYEEML